MKYIPNIFAALILVSAVSCNDASGTSQQQTVVVDSARVAGGQENVRDNDSEKDIVKVAVSSKDHTTLVTALQKADLVTALSNAGPFTVFAPTNEAFAKLPAGTVDELMKDSKKEDLRNILQYHVTLGVLKPESITEGQKLGMVNGDDVVVSVKNGKIILNNSVHVLTSIPASNGIIYVVDGILLPVSK
jgi:uncharacterized surface protein with fasciclin (FAS1) repeats